MNKELLCKIFTKKIALLFICITLFASVSNANSSILQQKSVTINMQNATIKEILKTIQTQTGLNFVYSDKELPSSVRKSLNVKNRTVESVLSMLFDKNDFHIEIVKNSITITKNDQKSSVQSEQKPFNLIGTVVDEKNKPILGVTILIKGSTKGAITDEKGKFSISVNSGDNLEVSCVGYKTEERSVTQQSSNLVIKLETDAMKVNDIVVTGYFNKNRESYTGAASSFTGEELRQINPVNVLSALSILDPSFKMVENNIDGSNPNVIPQFEVRGSSSMPNMKNEYDGNPNMPTFIMDGFEVTAEKVFDMDPSRIESLTLLKDAAATAIYGSRASNGVVVITTKMPKRGTLRLSYNVDLSFNLPDLTDYDLLNAREKLELERSAGFYESIVPHLQEEREDQYNYKLGMVNRGYDTYWLNKPIRSAVGHKHSLSVEGGENAMRYGIDLTYDSSPGLMRESERERIGISMMLQYQLKNVVFKNSITYDVMNSNNSPYGSFSQYATANPYYAYEDPDGNLLYLLEDDKRGAFSNVSNPLYNTQLHTIDKASYGYFINNFSLDWEVVRGLRLKGNIAIRHKKEEGILFKPAKHTDFSNYSEEDLFRKGLYKPSEGLEFGYDANVVLTYFLQKGEHAISLNAAVNIQDMASESYSVSVEGFPDENLDYITFGAQYHKFSKPSGKDQISRLIGVVANVNYSYNERYFIDGSLRTDASSKFGANSRWAPFGSVGIGWNIHNEKFAKEYLSFISRMKIRGSIGWVGSQNFSPFQAIPKYEYDVANRYRYGIGANLKGIANRDLKWQQTTQRNIGTDIELFNRRLLITFNYYKNTSKSLLTDITLPPSLGFSTYMANVGEIENKGYDFKVRATLFKTKESYANISVGAMHNRNKLMKISNSLTAWNESQDNEVSNAPKVRYFEGQSLNTIWAVESKGINPANGKEVFIDRFGNRTDVWDPKDQMPIGVKDSDIEGNISLNGGFKGFQLSLYMQYRLGGQEYNHTLVSRVENADKRYNCDRRVLEDRWIYPGDVTFFKDIRNSEITQATSRFIQDYSFLQLSSLSLSYDFSGDWMKHCHIQNLRLTFYMNDVARWSTIKAERGLDYPFARSFRTSLRITF